MYTLDGKTARPAPPPAPCGARLVHPADDIAFEIEQSHQRIRFADAQVIAREDSQLPSAVEQVLQVFEDSVKTTLQHEADDDVGSICCGQLRDDVRQERVVATGDQTLGRGIGGVEPSQIVPPARNDMTNAAARIGNVTVVPGNDVNVEMRNRLAGRRAHVDANVESVRRVSSQHCLAWRRQCPRSAPLAQQASRRTSSRHAARDDQGVPV